MYIPSKVKVGHMVYEVSVVSDPIIVDHRECSGMIDYMQGRIKLSDQNVQGDFARFQTFWHEVFHAFVKDRELQLDDEERVVDELGKSMAAFFIDNNLHFKEETNG